MIELFIKSQLTFSFSEFLVGVFEDEPRNHSADDYHSHSDDRRMDYSIEDERLSSLSMAYFCALLDQYNDNSENKTISLLLVLFIHVNAI